MAEEPYADTAPHDGAAMEAYVASLLPLQQQAIATAQLAGCYFERHSTKRDLRTTVRQSYRGRPYREPEWIETTEYCAFLPDGTYIGAFEDIYEGALACLSVLNTPEVAGRPDAANLFALLPENESER